MTEIACVYTGFTDTGKDPGEVIVAPAGSVVVFSSLTLHGSGDNRTARPRRALNLAFTQAEATSREELKHESGVPLIVDGEVTGAAARLRLRAAM